MRQLLPSHNSYRRKFEGVTGSAANLRQLVRTDGSNCRKFGKGWPESAAGREG
jgi:hypothetical protein